MTEAYDAIVLGAGPAGGIAALMLAQAGRRVAIVEKAAFPRRKVCGEFLSATNAPLFARLGLAESIAAQAGPPIRRVGLYAREATLSAPMPHRTGEPWGRALGREVLDTLLLDAARRAGARVWQPWCAAAISRQRGLHHVTLTRRGDGAALAAPIVIDAQGSADRGHARPRLPGDLLGMKAHFLGARLDGGLMPVLVFPGGYGGLVTTDGGRVTFGCCLRRDVLEQARTTTGLPAGEAALWHVRRHCAGVSEVLDGATRQGAWLGDGAIRPGIRTAYADGVFRIGNAAGETHPLIGEGMSMAMQGAWLLATTLAAEADLDQAGAVYGRAWRRRFAPRIAAAGLYARLAMRPATVSLCLPVLTRLPGLLTLGARASGKTATVVC